MRISSKSPRFLCPRGRIQPVPASNPVEAGDCSSTYLRTREDQGKRWVDADRSVAERSGYGSDGVPDDDDSRCRQRELETKKPEPGRLLDTYA